MSIRVLTWVMHESPSTGNDRLVLLAIADEANDTGGNAFPGIDRIAHKARVSRSTALRCIERLEAAGELAVTRPEQYGRGRVNRYVVLMGRPNDKGVTLTPLEAPGLERKGVTESPKRCQPTPEKVSPSETIPVQTQIPPTREGDLSEVLKTVAQGELKLEAQRLTIRDPQAWLRAKLERLKSGREASAAREYLRRGLSPQEAARRILEPTYANLVEAEEVRARRAAEEELELKSYDGPPAAESIAAIRARLGRPA
jgi:hypothetical protein